MLTGSSGFLGSHLHGKLEEKGWRVYGLSRKNAELVGDVTTLNFKLDQIPPIDALFHAAGIINLGRNRKGEIWRANVEGTRNAVRFCRDHGISKLYLVSTAFDEGRNHYELSKQQAEYETKLLCDQYDIKLTTFKPSLIVGENTRSLGALYQVVFLIARIHRRLDALRKRVEGILRLPPLEAAFRLPGDPDAVLDMVPVEWVADQMASIDGGGTFYLTNQNSPTIAQLADWVGELLWLHITVHPEDFTPSVIEAMFQRAGASFLLYLREGPNFTPSVPGCPQLDKDYIQRTILKNIL